MRTILAALLLLFIITSCTKEDPGILKSEDFLVGSWSNIHYSDSTFTVKKVSSLNDDEYGFTFNADFTFIEHKNEGWCGTPPISYADFDGTWSESDSVISISVAYWGGVVDYQWKVLSKRNDKLELWRMKEDFHMNEE